jgi:hypothetical protein
VIKSSAVKRWWQSCPSPSNLGLWIKKKKQF